MIQVHILHTTCSILQWGTMHICPPALLRQNVTKLFEVISIFVLKHFFFISNTYIITQAEIVSARGGEKAAPPVGVR